jgi:hypothetical protein
MTPAEKLYAEDRNRIQFSLRMGDFSYHKQSAIPPCSTHPAIDMHERRVQPQPAHTD